MTDLHQRLASMAAETNVRHHPMCGAHPVMDDGPCACANGTLAALIRALIAIHQPRQSRSINTLGCDQHNVTKGPPTWRDDPDYEVCPDCVVTPITVCSCESCEYYPCRTVRAVADTLGLTERATESRRVAERYPAVRVDVRVLLRVMQLCGLTAREATEIVEQHPDTLEALADEEGR